MSNRPSTYRTTTDPTLAGSPTVSPELPLQQIIATEWRDSGEVDLVTAVQRHPSLLRNRSLLLDLAVEEFRAHRQVSEISDLERHCSRFREFGGSIERSIFRQLEALRFIDDCCDVSELFSPVRWPSTGEAFGSFHVLEELGSGSIARVYLCLQSELGNRRVVVKATPYSDIEASILGRLSHPNITPIFSTGFIEQFDLHYLCMPFSGRSTLVDLLDVAFEHGLPRGDNCVRLAAIRWSQNEDDPLGDGRQRSWSFLNLRTYVDSILSLAIQIADALDHSHQQGILHGDLKPSNVLLTPSGRPLLLDFNLSQDYTRSIQRCGGTLPYMPPEHLQLVARQGVAQPSPQFDAASDVFSFGALLYELLTGVRPVTVSERVDDLSEIASLLLGQLCRGVPPLRDRNPHVSRRLEALVLQCLAFDGSDRPGSMADVRRHLAAELRWPASLGRYARLRPIVFSLITVLPLSLVCGTGMYIAVQPSAHLRSYERGIGRALTGHFSGAAESFSEAIEFKPSFDPARFQRGRAHIQLGELDMAMNDFSYLSRKGDAQSMAYLAYCFNLKRIAVAAIAWYERAITNHFTSVAVYNNLGASYLVDRSYIPRADQTRLAELYLLKALALDSESITVQLNLVRLATAKSRMDPAYDPFQVWRHALAILNARPSDNVIRSHVATWYLVVLRREMDLAGPEHFANNGSIEERRARAAFARLQQSTPATDKAESFAPAEQRRSDEAEPSPASHYFLEPLLLNGAGQPPAGKVDKSAADICHFRPLIST